MKNNGTSTAIVKTFMYGFVLTVFVVFNLPVVFAQDTDPCPSGFTRDGAGNCTIDINECSNGTSDCPPGRTCVNTYGSYVCVCINDTDGDGICDEIDNCPSIANADQADTNGDGVGDVCTVTAPTVAASNIVFSNIYSDRAAISFEKGNGTHRAVLMRNESSSDELKKVEAGEVKKASEAPAAAEEKKEEAAAAPAAQPRPAVKTACKSITGNNTGFFTGNSHYQTSETVCFNSRSYHLVYADTGNVVHVTGLSRELPYEVVVVEYNRFDSTDYYNTVVSATDTLLLSAPPNVYVTSPADSSTNRKTKLNITSKAVTGTSLYTIEISPVSDFSTGILAKSGGRTLLFDSLQYNKKYYTRVKTNLRPDYGKSTTFTTLPAEQLAYVISPKDSAVNLKAAVYVTSNLVPLALAYTIELNTSPDFSGTSVVQTGGRKQLFDSLQYNTTYYSRVKTEFTENWGATRSFKTIDATLISYVVSPKDTAVNQNTNLKIIANNVPGATEYTIQLSESPDFSTIAFEVSSETRTLVFSGLKYNTTYYNRVRTNLSGNPCTTECESNYTSCVVNAAGDPDTIVICEENYSSCLTNCATGGEGWGIVRSFKTRTAESLSYVTSPANGAIGRNTNLNISSNIVPGASEYTIQLSESSDFSTIAFEVTGGTRTLAFAGLKYNTTYYNRVRTNLSSSAEGCQDNCVAESFICVDNANGDPALEAICEETYNECITNCGAGGVAWGATRSFTTRTAESISYVTSPGDGAIGRNTTLNISSNNVPGATEYTIQLSESPDFSTIAFEVSSETRTLAFSGLKYNTTYYNRVRTNQSISGSSCVDQCNSEHATCVENAGGDPDIIEICDANYLSCLEGCPAVEDEGWGMIRSFTTRTAESISYVTSPADGAIDRNSNLNISSNIVPGAAVYTIQLSESPDFDTINFEMTGSTRTLAFSGLKYNTTYYNRVKTNLSTSGTACQEVCTALSFICVDNANGDPALEAICENSYNECLTACPVGDSWGITRSFTTRTAESISYVTSPTNGAIDRNTTLNISSNNVPGATSYTIQLSEDTVFSVIAFERTGPTRTLAFAGLKSGTTYYNRVSTNAFGAEGHGQRRSFTTKGTPPPAAAPPAVAPPAAAPPAAAAAAPAARISSNSTPDDQAKVVEGSVELKEFDVRVFPNPFREKLILHIESRSAQRATITLMDMNGKAVHESIEPTNTTVEIVRPLSVGVYMLRVTAGTQYKMIRVMKTD